MLPIHRFAPTVAPDSNNVNGILLSVDGLLLPNLLAYRIDVLLRISAPHVISFLSSVLFDSVD
jgi:hypothetical protein